MPINCINKNATSFWNFSTSNGFIGRRTAINSLFHNFLTNDYHINIYSQRHGANWVVNDGWLSGGGRDRSSSGSIKEQQEISDKLHVYRSIEAIQSIRDDGANDYHDVVKDVNFKQVTRHKTPATQLWRRISTDEWTMACPFVAFCEAVQSQRQLSNFKINRHFPVLFRSECQVGRVRPFAWSSRPRLSPTSIFIQLFFGLTDSLSTAAAVVDFYILYRP